MVAVLCMVEERSKSGGKVGSVGERRAREESSAPVAGKTTMDKTSIR